MSTFERIHNLFGDFLSKHGVITTASPDPSYATYKNNTLLYLFIFLKEVVLII